MNESNTSTLSILHVNICSLQKNFDSLQEFLYLLPRFPQIICLSEARINQTPLINIELPNYKLLHNDSPTRAGGVAIYVACNIDIEIVSELYLNVDGCENI